MLAHMQLSVSQPTPTYRSRGAISAKHGTDIVTPLHSLAHRHVGPSTSCSAAPLSASYMGACAGLEDGTIKCWGSNYRGQAGDGSSLDFKVLPVTVAGLTDVSIYHQSVAAGASHTCALLVNTTVACWGYNGDGELGQGDTSITFSPVPLIVKGLADVDSVAAGHSHTCVVLRNNTVQCWGSDADYKLGSGAPVVPGGPEVEYRSTPQAVAGLTEVHAVSLGESHSCALSLDGQVFCWGSNERGELGDVSGEYGVWNSTPVQVVLQMKALEIACGDSHTGALLEDNTVACWGRNDFGQVGCDRRNLSECPSNVHRDVVLPIVVAGLTQVRHVATGYYQSCAVLANHTARCWGNNGNGQLGDGTFDVVGKDQPKIMHPTPVVVALGDIADIAGGGSHTCAVLTNFSVACWGGNWHGQTGSGSSVDPMLTPVLAKVC